MRARSPCSALVAWVVAAGICLGSGPGEAEDASGLGGLLTSYQNGLSAARQRHDAHRTILARAAPSADDPAVAPLFTDAQQHVDDEARALRNGEAVVARVRALGDSPAAWAIARDEIFPATATAARTFADGQTSIDRLAAAVAPVRIRRFGREVGGTRRVPGVMFARSGDRILARSPQIALEDVSTLLATCGYIRVEVASRPAPHDPASAELATKRAAEVRSYLVQKGAAPESVVTTAGGAGADAPAVEADPLVWREPAPVPDDSEDGHVIISVVRGCP